MSRKHRKIDSKRIQPDRRFGDETAARFINCLMKAGKKSVAETIFYSAMDKIVEKNVGDPIDVFLQALERVKPSVEVKSRRVGGWNYQIPIAVRPVRRKALAIRWLLTAARNRGERTMADRLANELLDAFNQTGTAVKKREDTHRMAEANKAFAHYRW